MCIAPKCAVSSGPKGSNNRILRTADWNHPWNFSDGEYCLSSHVGCCRARNSASMRRAQPLDVSSKELSLDSDDASLNTIFISLDIGGDIVGATPTERCIRCCGSVECIKSPARCLCHEPLSAKA